MRLFALDQTGSTERSTLLQQGEIGAFAHAWAVDVPPCCNKVRLFALDQTRSTERSTLLQQGELPALAQTVKVGWFALLQQGEIGAFAHAWAVDVPPCCNKVSFQLLLRL